MIEPEDLDPLPTDEHEKLKANVLENMAMFEGAYQTASSWGPNVKGTVLYPDITALFADIRKLLTGDPQE